MAALSRCSAADVRRNTGPGACVCSAQRGGARPATLTLTLGDANWVELRHCQKRMYSINIYSAEALFGDVIRGAVLRDVRGRSSFFFLFLE